MRTLRALLPALVSPGLLLGQEIAKVDRGAERASVLTRPDARTMTLTIPAPRGLITDRKGRAMAQNRVGYQFALEFEHFQNPGDPEIQAWARLRLEYASKLAGRAYTVSDRRLLEHYRNRRWLPLRFSSLVDPAKEAKFKQKLMDGLVMSPFYYRHYPEGKSAAHLLGYVRSKGKLPTGPLVHGDLLFEDTDGKAGLEQTMDQELTGRPGERKLIFGSGGEKLRDELTQRPRIGQTVVTTLDLDWQKHAEKVLEEHCERGAFVVIDIPTGEVLVMASRPSYDINVWIPRISNADLKALNEDESHPMFARSFQGSYPPASCFKPVLAVTALTNNTIEEWTEIDCPAYIEIGKKKMWNHTRKPEGELDVARALARSNNCFFYQVGMMMGPNSFLGTARRLGFGARTGLPLFGESSGRVPTHEYVLKRFGRPFTDGDTANYSIGQAWEATPLQVAQSMAGIANGSVLPRLQLIKQVQDPSGGVLRAAEPESRNSLSLDPDAVQIVHKGMYDVVNAPWGTGKRGALSFADVAGKTGTGQWNSNAKLEVAWFAGFFPYENPRLAFAILYEGSPEEHVSGGSKAAPMAPEFFEHFKSEIKDMIKPPARALIVVEEGDVDPAEVGLPIDDEGRLITPSGKILRAIPVEPLELEKSVPAEPLDPGEALPVIPVEDAPVAIPVAEDE